MSLLQNMKLLESNGIKKFTSDCGSISGMSSVHPGRPIVDKDGKVTYSDARIYNLKEKLILLGFPNGETWCYNKPQYKVPEWASDNLINIVLDATGRIALFFFSSGTALALNLNGGFFKSLII